MWMMEEEGRNISHQSVFPASLCVQRHVLWGAVADVHVALDGVANAHHCLPSHVDRLRRYRLLPKNQKSKLLSGWNLSTHTTMATTTTGTKAYPYCGAGGPCAPDTAPQSAEAAENVRVVEREAVIKKRCVPQSISSCAACCTRARASIHKGICMA